MKFGVTDNTGASGVVDPDALIAVARHADRGVDRLVIGSASAKASEQRDQLSAFAGRLALG